MNNNRFSKKRILLVAAALVVVAAALTLVYRYARNLEVASYPAPEMKGYTPVNAFARRFVLDNKEYVYKSDLTAILFMGIDKPSNISNVDPVSGFIDYRNGGQADFLMLFVLDHGHKTITRLMIDRDTMAEITTLGIFGNVSGTRIERLSISHGFGDGREQSAELTVEAVGKWLMGIDIDFYIAMNLDGIPKLNDEVGGVTVKVDDDFGAIDPALTPGATVKLMGNQATTFVRTRMNIGSGTNEARMRRQRVYLNALADVVSEKLHADINWIDRLFDALSGSMITNMSRGRMVNEGYKAMNYTVGPLTSVLGEHTVDAEGFQEFWADPGEVTKWVLNTFAEEAPTSAN